MVEFSDTVRAPVQLISADTFTSVLVLIAPNTKSKFVADKFVTDIFVTTEVVADITVESTSEAYTSPQFKSPDTTVAPFKVHPTFSTISRSTLLARNRICSVSVQFTKVSPLD